METISTQLVNVDDVQSNQGANISISLERYLLHDYIDITPYAIGHASKDDPPLMAVGKGMMEIVTKSGDKMYTLLYHVLNSLGTLLSPDFFCSESSGKYHSFTIHGDITTGFGTIYFCHKDN